MVEKLGSENGFDLGKSLDVGSSVYFVLFEKTVDFNLELRLN